MSARSTSTFRYVSLTEAAEYLAVSTDSVRRRIAEGKLPAYRVGPRSVRIKLLDLDALLERIPAGSGE